MRPDRKCAERVILGRGVGEWGPVSEPESRSLCQEAGGDRRGVGVKEGMVRWGHLGELLGARVGEGDMASVQVPSQEEGPDPHCLWGWRSLPCLCPLWPETGLAQGTLPHGDGLSTERKGS